MERFYVYWFPVMGAHYTSGAIVQSHCATGVTLDVIGLPAVYLLAAKEKRGDRYAWIDLRGGYDGNSPSELLPAFKNIEDLITPQQTSFDQIWAQNRRTVDDRLQGRPVGPTRTRQQVAVSTAEYTLPLLKPPESQRLKVLDRPFVNSVVAFLRADLGRNARQFCPCQIAVPYFDVSDPLLYVLIRFKTGERTVRSFSREVKGDSPRETSFVYHGNDMDHLHLADLIAQRSALVFRITIG